MVEIESNECENILMNELQNKIVVTIEPENKKSRFEILNKLAVCMIDNPQLTLICCLLICLVIETFLYPTKVSSYIKTIMVKLLIKKFNITMPDEMLMQKSNNVSI